MCFYISRQNYIKNEVHSQFDYHSENRIEILCLYPCRTPQEVFSRPDSSRKSWTGRILARMSTSVLESDPPSEKRFLKKLDFSVSTLPIRHGQDGRMDREIISTFLQKCPKSCMLQSEFHFSIKTHFFICLTY